VSLKTTTDEVRMEEGSPDWSFPYDPGIWGDERGQWVVEWPEVNTTWIAPEPSNEDRRVAALERIADALERIAPTVVLTVIDGEACIAKDEMPPGAKLPNPDSGLFKLAQETANALVRLAPKKPSDSTDWGD